MKQCYTNKTFRTVGITDEDKNYLSSFYHCDTGFYWDGRVSTFSGLSILSASNLRSIPRILWVILYARDSRAEAAEPILPISFEGRFNPTLITDGRMVATDVVAKCA